MQTQEKSSWRMLAAGLSSIRFAALLHLLAMHLVFFTPQPTVSRQLGILQKLGDPWRVGRGKPTATDKYVAWRETMITDVSSSVDDA